MEPQRILLWVLLTFSIISISSAGAVFQLMDDVPPLLRASWRFQLTTLMMAPLCFIQYRGARHDQTFMSNLMSQETRYILFGSGISLGLHMGAWVWSLDNTSLSHSLLFVPIFSIALNTLLLCLSILSFNSLPKTPILCIPNAIAATDILGFVQRSNNNDVNGGGIILQKIHIIDIVF